MIYLVVYFDVNKCMYIYERTCDDNNNNNNNIIVVLLIILFLMIIVCETKIEQQSLFNEKNRTCLILSLLLLTITYASRMFNIFMI